MKCIGITAPRGGLTPIQDDVLAIFMGALRAGGATEFHHGDCCGGDERGAEIARWFQLTIVGHPPVKIDWRAHFPSDEEREPREYLARDRALVDEVDLLIGLPDTNVQRPRSGTWYTIGYAEMVDKPRIVVGPTGRLLYMHGVSDVLDRVVKATLAVVIRARTNHEPPIRTTA